MNIFLDTEFTGLHQKTTLISIGLVSECGKTFYAEFNDFDNTQVDEWLQNNVISNLKFNGIYQTLKKEGDHVWYKGISDNVKEKLIEWLSQFSSIEIWSDCLSYDWVLFNEIFGHAFNLPSQINYIPFDICTFFKLMRIDPDISREDFVGPYKTKELEHLFGNLGKHNALWDALIIRECYNKLQGL